MFYKKGKYYKRRQGKEWMIFLCGGDTMLSSVHIKVISYSKNYNISNDLIYGHYYFSRPPVAEEIYLIKNMPKDKIVDEKEVVFEMI